MDGARLEQLSKFKYMGYIVDESGKAVTECCRKVTNERKIAGAIRSLVNARGLQLESTMVLHQGLLVTAMLYGSETRIWREN